MQHKENTPEVSLSRKAKIGRNIRQIRLLKGIEVKHLCRDLQLSTAAYSNIERGVTDINLSRLMQLAEYFSIPCAHILDECTHNLPNSHTPLCVEEPPQCGIMEHNPLTIALAMARDEISFLKDQNTRLLEQLFHKDTDRSPQEMPAGKL